MGDYNGVDYVGNEAVSYHRGLGREVAYLFRERRDYDKTVLIDGRSAIYRDI